MTQITPTPNPHYYGVRYASNGNIRADIERGWTGWHGATASADDEDAVLGLLTASGADPDRLEAALERGGIEAAIELAQSAYNVELAEITIGTLCVVHHDGLAAWPLAGYTAPETCEAHLAREIEALSAEERIARARATITRNPCATETHLALAGEIEVVADLGDGYYLLRAGRAEWIKGS